MSPVRIAAAPCSWGVLELDVGGPASGYERVLDEMARAGYAGTELGDWGFLPTDPERLRHELGSRHLELMAAFVPVRLADERSHPGGRARALETAQLLAAVSQDAFVVLSDENGADPERTRCAGRIRPEQSLSDDGWATFARGAEAIARVVLEATGVRTVFHHHSAGFVETPAEVEELLARTSAELFGLCLDTGHYAFGGGDPLAALERHRDRIWHVHLKDHDPEVALRARAEEWDYFESVRRGVFCELGRGDVPFPSIVEQLLPRYGGWLVVEQDVLPGMGTPLESAERNRGYLRALGLQ